jgi:hypothetical protein
LMTSVRHFSRRRNGHCNRQHSGPADPIRDQLMEQ